MVSLASVPRDSRTQSRLSLVASGRISLSNANALWPNWEILVILVHKKRDSNECPAGLDMAVQACQIIPTELLPLHRLIPLKEPSLFQTLHIMVGLLNIGFSAVLCASVAAAWEIRDTYFPFWFGGLVIKQLLPFYFAIFEFQLCILNACSKSLGMVYID